MTRLETAPIAQVVREVVLEGEIFAFKNTPGALGTLAKHLQDQLGVAPANLRVVGSAKTGFSLSPDTFLRAYSDQSDIDVVVVDTAMFDEIWTTIRGWHYLRPQQLPKHELDWAKNRTKDVFWGCFSPDEISRGFGGMSHYALRALRDRGTLWFNTFRSLSRFGEFRSRKVNGRLYRTLQHAAEYHEWSLRLAHSIYTKGTAE